MGQISLYEFKQNIKIVFFCERVLWPLPSPSLENVMKRKKPSIVYSMLQIKHAKMASCQYLHLNPPPGYDIKQTFCNKIVQNLFVLDF